MKNLIIFLSLILFASCEQVKTISSENNTIISEYKLDSLLLESSESIKLYSEALSDTVENIEFKPILDSIYIDENSELIGNFIYNIKQTNKNKIVTNYFIHLENYSIVIINEKPKNWHIINKNYEKFINQ